ncbi:hypothetical protein [Corynebacterium striatum]|uniref:hypothetical protein n=1 Tax=Corynebacterium striatum TaxID=43770 RepID=UPI001F0B27DD|nr:hypothetical protein [Corynebacterium striatum]
MKTLRAIQRGASVAAVTAVMTAVLAVAPAQAQDATVSVPAGQTSTVTLPVPVEVSFAENGWNISASGGTATITAPAEGGEVTVPVSYEGTTLNLTLVADGSVTQEDLNNAGEDIANGGDGGAIVDEGGAAGGQGAGPGEGGAAAGMPGMDANANPAAVGGVDVSQAEYINLDATIEGRTIKAQLGIKQALDLYNRFKNTNKDDHTLRYINAKGEFIKGVERRVDKASRTLELTYPDGQTPDNPFIMELVRDSDKSAVLIVTLHDPNKDSSGVLPAEQQTGLDGNRSDSNESSSILPWAGGAVGVLLLGVLAWFFARRGNSSTKSSSQTG